MQDGAAAINMGASWLRRGMPTLISMGQMSVTAYQSDKTNKCQREFLQRGARRGLTSYLPVSGGDISADMPLLSCITGVISINSNSWAGTTETAAHVYPTVCLPFPAGRWSQTGSVNKTR